MVIKTNYQASEYPFNEQDLIEDEVLKLVPLELKDESLIFIERNHIPIPSLLKKKTKVICPRCLKAHLVHKARKMNNHLLENAVYDSFDCEIGHNGYYLDKEKVIKIPSI